MDRDGFSAEPPEKAADDFIAAVLRADPDLPVLTPDASAMLPARSFHHGVAALVSASANATAHLSDPVRMQIDAEVRALAMWDMRHRQVLVPLLDAFAEVGISAVLLKGTALAYSFYSSPAMRQRGDTDVLVSPQDMESARRILSDQGFVRSLDSTIGTGAEANRQESWTRAVADSTLHAIDLHWGVMRAWSLADLFDTSEVIAHSVPLPDLSPAARRIGTVDALYHACLHRAVHIKTPYFVGEEKITGGDRLIWIYDVHLLVPQLSPTDWDEFVARATRDKTADLCLDTLARAARLLASPVPVTVLETLEQWDATDGPSFYLTQASEGQRVLLNLKAVPGFAGKLAYLKTTFFPARIYMRQKYPEMTRYPVAVLYLRRILDRLLRRTS